MPFDLDCLEREPAHTEPNCQNLTDLAGLMSIAAQLGADEQAVLQLVAERLLAGQRRYGRFDLATDRRDFRREAIEEISDALVYAAAVLMGERSR